MTAPHETEDHLMVPAGECVECLTGPVVQTPAWWANHPVRAHECSVHGVAVTFRRATRGSVTIRCGLTPSPTSLAWLDAVRTGRTPQVRTATLTQSYLSQWLGEEAARGISEPDAAVFAWLGIPAPWASLFLSRGVYDPLRMLRMLALRMLPEELVPWLDAGVHSPDLIPAFAHEGVAPVVAARFSDIDEWVFTVAAHVPQEQAWGLLSHEVDPMFARAAHRAGATAEQVHALAAALAVMDSGEEVGFDWPKFEVGRRVFVSTWSTKQAERRMAVLARLDGLDLSDAATCLTAGMGVEETVQHLRSGADMAPVRLLAGLAR